MVKVPTFLKRGSRVRFFKRAIVITFSMCVEVVFVKI